MGRILKNFCKFFKIVLTTLSLQGWCAAQDEPRGGLRGVVQDADFYAPVSGTSLSLEPGGKVVTSDSEGRFFFNDLTGGVYRLVAAKEGYVRTSLNEITVTPGRVQEVSIAITGEVLDLDEFVVSTIEEEEIEAAPLSLGASLQSFASSVAPELMKAASSSGDIGSAAKRLASTAVVDSRYVVIRGLSDRYNVVVLNGARVPSSDPDRRAVNIDIFPAGLVETLVSSKTFVPSMPGEVTGGYLNIVTKRLPKEPFFRFSVSPGYNTRATGNPSFQSYRGGGTGFLGSAESRELPNFMRNLVPNPVPLLTTNRFYFDPPRTDNPATTQADIDNKGFSESGLKIAKALSGRGTGVNTKTAPMNFSFSALGGTRVEDFFGGDLGLIGGLTYGKKYQLDQGLRGNAGLGAGAPGQPAQPFATVLGNYTRGTESLLAGALLGASLEFSPENTISLTYFGNLAADDDAVFTWGSTEDLEGFNDGTPLEQKDEIFIRENLIYTERRLQTMQLTGEHKFPEHGDIKIDWLAAYSMSSQNQPDIRKAFYGYEFSTQTYIAAGDPSPPDFERIWRRLDDTNYNIALNADLPWGGDADDLDRSKLEFGFNMDYSTREYDAQNFEYNGGGGALAPRISKATPDDAQTITLGDALGQLDVTDQVSREFDVPPGHPLFGKTRYDDSLFLVRGFNLPVSETYTATQNIPAFYGSATFNLGEELEVTAGGRVESTDIAIRSGTAFSDIGSTNASADILLNDPLTGEPFPLDALANPGIVRTDLLPALAVRWELMENHTIRTAVSRTVARPTFKELAPAIARDPESGDLFVGYVLLEMSSVTNYDVRYEWDLGNSDLLAFSLFAKQIDKPIEQVFTGVFNTVRNEDAASLYGFEIELNKKLGTLLPILEGLTGSLNYGFVTSQVDLNERNEELRVLSGLPSQRPLQGQPDYTFNANLAYDNKEFGLTAGVLLNVTGPLLYAVGGFGGSTNIPDIFQRPLTTVDAYLSKEILPGWELSFRVSNLTDAIRKREFGESQIPYSVISSGTTYSLGITGKW
ncbi:MAG: TonB-dependent receptor [Verrucomicrobiaceae bacterium]|nr:TonB-dependent receptor [Verrucomicrobiaceae bacterium]